MELGYAGRLHSREEVERHHADQAAINAKMTEIDPERAFERGRADGLRRVNQTAGLPFDQKEFDAETA